MTKTEMKKIAEQEFIKKIKKYLSLKKNQEPDPAYCPKLYLTWWTQTNGYMVKNLTTGKLIKNKNEMMRIAKLPNWQRDYSGIHDNKTNEYTTSPNVHRYCHYVKADYNLGIIEFSSITIDTKRTNGPTKFTFLGSRVFMSMDNRKLWAHKQYLEDPEIISINDYVYRVPQCYYSCWYFTQLKLQTYLTDTKSARNSAAINVLYGYFQHKGIKSYFNGKQQVEINSVDDFSKYRFVEWLKSKKLTKSAIDKEQIIKEITEAQLENAEKKYNIKNHPLIFHQEEGPEGKAYYYGRLFYERYKDFDVFRMFDPCVTKETMSGYTYWKNLRSHEVEAMSFLPTNVKWIERTRIFCRNNKVYVTTWDSYKDKFTYLSGVNPIRRIEGNFYYIEDIKKLKELKAFQYTKDFIQNYTRDFTEYLIATRKPIAEQLLKIGCKKISSAIMNNNQVSANLREFVGTINCKEKNLKDVFGMTVKQLQCLELYLDENVLSHYGWSSRKMTMQDISFIYELFSGKPFYWNKNDITGIDLQTFENSIKLVLSLKHSNVLHFSWSFMYAHHSDDCKYESTFNMLCPANVESKYKYICKILSFCEKAGLSIGTIADNARMYNRLSDEFRPENFNLEYDCASDVTRIHDALVELTAAQDAEAARIRALQEDERNKVLEKKMEKIDEKRKLLEYEDDIYLIRLPKKLSELTTEGTVQRICIGGYINSHAEGNANIYFLRKKSKPDIPFFAIEEKGGHIVQIHGYCNKWLGADDDSFAAVSFVMRWLHKNQLSCDQKILTSRATGYSCGNQFRELPKIEYEV